MAVCALAGPSDPGETAVHFLEKVRTQNLNLEPGGDTALSPQTSGQKRREIARRLERVARDLGTDPLEVGAMKLDDDLAAVLVRKIGGFDPSRLQVFPVALVKRGAEWAAAPVPASFENSGVGYAAVLRKRLAILEDWMLREQALDLEKLRDQSADRLRRKIAESLPLATLRNFTSKQAAERFLTACEHRNLPEIFGLLGGLAANLPNDWPLRLTAADTAVTAAGEVKRPWRLLLGAEVMRALVDHVEESDTAQVSIACLDPGGIPPRFTVPRIELVHLELVENPGRIVAGQSPRAFPRGSRFAGCFGGRGSRLGSVGRVPGETRRALPPGTASHGGRNPPSPANHAANRQPGGTHAHTSGSDGDPLTARKSCVRAAQLWWAWREPSAVRSAVPLAYHEEGSQAAEAFQFFSARNPDRLDLRILYFEKSGDGWHWTPMPRPETEKSFREWVDLQSKRWQDEWQDALLTDCPILKAVPDSGAPPAEESRQLVEAWIQATRAGDVLAALRLTARFDTPDSPVMLLRNLGYEMTGARRTPHAPALAGIYRGAIWTAVGTQTDSKDPPLFPLYPVIATPAGPRIVLEIDLFTSGNRSRDFLNKTALGRLRQSSAPAADELAVLLSKHQSQAAGSNKK